MKIIALITKQLEKFLAPFPLLIKLYGLYYRNMVRKEIEQGNVSSRDRVLCIGGGPLPCTALEIARQTGARVQVIDYDLAAVSIARRVIARLNMEDKVKVIQAGGQHVDVGGFTVVHVARQASPLVEILENVWFNSPQGARILIRTPGSGLKRFYAALPEGCLHNSCVNGQKNNSSARMTLVLLRGQGRVEDEKVRVAFNRLAIHGRTSLVG